MKTFLAILPLLALASCGPLQDAGVSGQTGFFKPADRFDPEASFGLFITKDPSAILGDKGAPPTPRNE
jgi:hypothetical protein